MRESYRISISKAKLTASSSMSSLNTETKQNLKNESKRVNNHSFLISLFERIFSNNKTNVNDNERFVISLGENDFVYFLVIRSLFFYHFCFIYLWAY